jgi:haloalkane dehalogenase
MVRPTWVNDAIYPFQSRWLNLDGHTVHYLDEGPRDAPVLLFMHGNPTWSFVYRDLIVALSTRFRCIAPDYPGFGLSSAASGYDFQPESHSRVVEKFIQHLDLKDITMIVQDWGGPIGLGAAGQMPERFKAFVIGDTRAWRPVSSQEKRGSSFFAGPVGTFLIRRFNIMTRLLVPLLHVRRKLNKDEHAHYLNALPDSKAWERTLILVRAINGAGSFLDRVEQRLVGLRHCPALIVWAEKDGGFDLENKRKFERAFPKHTSHMLPGTGHFYQEDAPDLVLEAFHPWWRSLNPSSSLA